MTGKRRRGAIFGRAVFRGTTAEATFLVAADVARGAL
jgi:hypothetical protein